jgi:hypothetical protein
MERSLGAQRALKRLLVVVVLVVAGASAALGSPSGAGAATLFDCNVSNELARNDDGSTGLVPIGFPMNVFGQEFDQLYVNNNGNVTFTGPLSAYVPFALDSTNTPIFAGFFTDIDTRGLGPPPSGIVTYGQTTYQGRPAFCVNYPEVGEYPSLTAQRNTFQMLFVERSDTGAGNFDAHYLYNDIQFDHGAAGVGYAAGTGDVNSHFELPGSRVSGAFLNSNASTGLVNNSLGSLELGHYIFAIRSGDSTAGGIIRGVVSGPGGPLANAPVQACLVTGSSCRNGITNATGNYQLVGATPGSYNLTVFSPAGSSLTPETVLGINVVQGGIHVIDVTLAGPTPLPGGTTFGGATSGIPSTVVGRATPITTTGCSGGAGTFTITGTYGGVYNGTLTEGPTGTYSGVATIPFTGPASVSITIEGCPPIEFNIYIDPSGFVRTTGGAGIPGATVTLYRSDTGAPGSFVQVPDGSAIMSPSNRTNPDTTDATGHFGWDTIAGFYTVRATSDGCHAPGDPGQAFVETAVLTIPPPVFDIDLRLECGEDGVAPVIAPHGDVTANATSRSGAVVGYTPPEATDDVDGAVAVTCAPAPGSLFAAGVTQVECSAGDAAGNVATESFAVTVLTFEEQLAALRAEVGGLGPALVGQQAKVRLASVLEFLDRALLPAGWDADGVLVSSSGGIAALRQIRMAVSYLRTPNVELDAASDAHQRDLIELGRAMAEAFYAERAAAGYNAARLSSARSHLDLAAANPGTPAALEQSIKAWDALDG